MSLVFVVSPYSSAANSEELISVYKYSRISQLHVKTTDEPFLFHVHCAPKPQHSNRKDTGPI